MAPESGSDASLTRGWAVGPIPGGARSDLPRRVESIGVYGPAADRLAPILSDLVGPGHVRACSRWDGLDEHIDEVEALVAFKFPGRRFPRETILRGARLRFLQLASAGVDHLGAFDPERLTVSNASGLHGETMAEYVIAVLVHLRWNFARLHAQQREHRWQLFEVPTLAGCTMAVIGAGHVGTTIAARARAFGMRVVATRRSGAPHPSVDEMFAPAGLHRALSQADVVVLSLPLTAETRGSIAAPELAAVPRGGVLINVSRGGVVDEVALLAALKAGHFSGAALDVFEREPLPAESEFWNLPNVLVTPHISSEFQDWPLAVAKLFRRNVAAWVSGEPLSHVVNPALGY